MLIRELHDEHVYENHVPHEWKKQFINLSGRITLLRWTIMFAAFGFLFNMLTVFALYLDEVFSARVIFGSCCLSMIISILFFIREIHISTNALKLHRGPVIQKFFGQCICIDGKKLMNNFFEI